MAAQLATKQEVSNSKAGHFLLCSALILAQCVLSEPVILTCAQITTLGAAIGGDSVKRAWEINCRGQCPFNNKNIHIFSDIFFSEI
jgi:hypothetical protein